MKLSRTVERLLLILTVFVLSFTFVFAAGRNNHDTFADDDGTSEVEDGEVEIDGATNNGTENGDGAVRAEAHFVELNDGGEKIIVKTTARTVGEVLKRAGVIINIGDKVEPAEGTIIDEQNFRVEIFRARPVVVSDGAKSTYIMSASTDGWTLAREAGFDVYADDVVEKKDDFGFLKTGAAVTYKITRGEDYARAMEELRRLEEERIAAELAAKEAAEAAARAAEAERLKNLARNTNVTPLTARRGVNRYYVEKADGTVVERKETYYDLVMGGLWKLADVLDNPGCSHEKFYTVRADGVKVDADGYIIVAADFETYPRCTVVETSLGLGKVYDTGSFAAYNSEQFDIATDWTRPVGDFAELAGTNFVGLESR